MVYLFNKSGLSAVCANCHTATRVSKAFTAMWRSMACAGFGGSGTKAMSTYFLDGEPPVEVRLRRSARARRLSLRVSQLDGRVTLTMPRFAAESEAHGFIREKAAWLRRHVARMEPETQVGFGGQIPFRGQFLQLSQGTGRKITLDDAGLRVPGPPERCGARVAAFLKETARGALSEASDRYAAQLGRPFARITLRDTRSRWGSCSSQGALMYSWRLIMAPVSVLDYVAAHEVAHLEHMNHSAAFWATVSELFGPHAEERRWLRERGHELHRYRFTD